MYLKNIFHFAKNKNLIKNFLEENKNKITTEEFTSLLNKLKAEQLSELGVSSGQIGFPMGQTESDSDIKGLFTGDQETLNKTYDNIRRIKDPQERKDALTAWKNSGAKYTGTNTMGITGMILVWAKANNHFVMVVSFLEMLNMKLL